MTDLYRENILHHYKHPQNFGHLQHADVSVDFRNSSCGDLMHLEIQWGSDGRVAEIAFMSDGCAISRAAASLLTEEMKGKTRTELAQFGHQDVYDLLSVEIGPGRVNCAMLPLDALRKVLQK